MAQDIYQLANDGVKALHPYEPGKPMDELARELGLEQDAIVKLASNENPLGCSELAKTAIREAAESLTLYPDGNGFALKKAILNHHRDAGLTLNFDNILLGNGSNDVLELVARTFLNKDSEAIFSEYAFAVYPIAVQAVSATAKVSPAKNWGHDLDAMLELVNDKTKVIFIANPNNPTGTWLDEGELSEFLAQVPDNIIVVLDEAYFEYVNDKDYPNSLNFLEKHNNIIVTRTFSKAYGLAGLRLGYGIASKQIIDLLNRVRQPFNVNAMAMAGGIAAIQDQDFIQQSIQCNIEGLAYLQAELDKIGLSYIDSAANFLSVDIGSREKALAANAYLLKHGLIVRSIAVYNLPSFLRITIGERSQNEMFINLLSEFLINA